LVQNSPKLLFFKYSFSILSTPVSPAEKTWIQQEQVVGSLLFENLLIEQLEDNVSATSGNSVITIEMDETSDCGSFKAIMAIENGLMELEISSGGFENTNEPEIEETLKRENFESSSSLTIPTYDEIPAIHSTPYTNRSLFKNPF
jgi:hypothetical protein